MVHRREHQVGTTELAAGCAQTSESLRTRDFMNDVTVNVKQRQFAGLLHHHVGVINLFVECFSMVFTSQSGQTAADRIAHFARVERLGAGRAGKVRSDFSGGKRIRNGGFNGIGCLGLVERIAQHHRY